MPHTVAIFSGEGLVGRALVLLLRDDGYNVRLIEARLPRELIPLLGEVHLVILGPRLYAELREAILGSIRSTQELAGLPVLELTTTTMPDKERDERVVGVPWPCRIVELEQRIDTALYKRTAL
jgi:2-polyprenyl-6-methoxyphenol hydroxylase-like FAD-dependent oxidoreductase